MLPISSDEYLMLKNEIVQCTQIVDNSRNILYVTVSAILAFAFTQAEPLIFVLPFIVIIPIYLVTLDNMSSIYKIGTYLVVFSGQGNFYWERRLVSLDESGTKNTTRFRTAFHTPYILTSIACIALFTYSMIANNFFGDLFLSLTRILIAALLLFVVMAIFLRYRDMIKIRKDYKDKWEKLKNAEGENNFKT